jgi:hypothetical protein
LGKGNKGTEYLGITFTGFTGETGISGENGCLAFADENTD